MLVSRRQFLKQLGISTGLLISSTLGPRVFGLQQTPIKIGGTLPLTGVFSATGIWVERSYRYWAQEINSRGGLLGRPVELLIYDDASSVDKAISLLERAITVDKVNLLAGGYPGTAAAAQMAIAEKYKMVYVSMGGHMKSFLQGFKYSFGAPPLMGEWWYLGVFDWMATLLPGDRPHKAAAATVNNLVGMAVRDSMYEGLKRLGIQLVMDELYDLPLPSADPFVAKAKALGADMFISNSFFDDGVLTIRSMRAQGYNPKIILQGVGTLIPEWATQLGKDGDYIFSGTAMHHKLPFPGVKEVGEAAKRLYNVPVPPQYFLFGYAWLQALQRGVEGAGSLDQDAIANYLRTHVIETIAGRLTFDEKGLPPPYNFATQVLKGEAELIWPPAVATASPVYPKPPWGG
jgi:branched-chain amino acid transport system substrate-binding protein